ncbi:MAG TPA: pentapeptide repeat-containing protein [Bdellovibrionales bacterium]|nr:pentapeptide repeat-containing protein [Bdellovibrionales bacterium]
MCQRHRLTSALIGARRLAAGLTVLVAAAACGRSGAFRYDANSGACLNELGQVGLNQGTLGPCSDLRNQTLSDVDLSGFDLSGSDFSNATLTNVSFHGARLRGARFYQTALFQVDFSEANLERAQPEAFVKNYSNPVPASASVAAWAAVSAAASDKCTD